MTSAAANSNTQKETTNVMTYEDAKAEMQATPPDANERLMFTAGIMPLGKSQLEFMLTLGIYDAARTQIIHDAIATQEAITRRMKRGRKTAQ